MYQMVYVVAAFMMFSSQAAECFGALCICVVLLHCHSERADPY